MKVAIISTDYPPLRTSAAVMLRDLAREFAAEGHEPVVVVPASGARQPWRVERDGDVEVLRLAACETREKSYIRRAIAELVLPYRMLRNLRLSPYGNTKWDIITWYSPPIFFAPLVRALRGSSGAHAYLILRDIFPEWALDLGILRRGPVYYGLKTIAAMQYAVADTIGVQSPANLVYVQPWARRGRRLEVLHNWLGNEPLSACSIDIAKTKLVGRTIFVYIGNMGVAQSVDILIDLASEMRGRRDVGFLFVGRGSEFARLDAEAAARRLDNVLFHAEIPSAEIPALLRQCHVGLVALAPRHKSHNIPGKFVSYTRHKLPTLARVNPGTDLVHLIADNDVGRCYAGHDVKAFRALAEELIAEPALLDAMALRASKLNASLFSPKAAVEQIVSAHARTSSIKTATWLRHNNMSS